MDSAQLQHLLRFLSQDAKLPLATAIGKVKELQKVSLLTAESISKASTKDLLPIFSDEKTAKQVRNAAKRSSKKRAAPSEATEHDSKRSKSSSVDLGDSISSTDLDTSLALPSTDVDTEELSKVKVFTNRAPLVLAFVVALLKYTMPNQPISSRLSLAHAYVSVSSRRRAVDLGIEKGASAEDEGWGAGQPLVKIMGKDIRVMRRSGYASQGNKLGPSDQRTEIYQEKEDGAETALWGLDLEALKTSNVSNALASVNSNSIPIYTAQSARSYLLKAATPVSDKNSGPKKKNSTASWTEESEKNLGMLLKAIDLVYQSWLPQIGPEGLDRRAWGWYAQVRPEIANGKEGWGAKNEVSLKEILGLRNESSA